MKKCTYPEGFKCSGKSNFITLRHTKFHYLKWENVNKPTIVMLHGFMDFAHTFDLLAEELKGSFNLIAWDAKGFGDTDWIHKSGYYHFFEYIYDLDLLLDGLNLSKVILLGHSMGGIISSLYAATFPERVEKLISLEGWFFKKTEISETVDKIRNWLKDLKSVKAFTPMKNIEDAALRLMKNDPLMPKEVAIHLAHEGTKLIDHSYVWKHDPIHKTRSVYQTNLDQIKVLLEKIECPCLLLKGEHLVEEFKAVHDTSEYFKNSKIIEIKNSSHNLHLHQPKIIGKIIKEFVN